VIPGDEEASTVIHQLLESTCDNIGFILFAIKKQFRISARHLFSLIPLYQFFSVVITTALVGALALLAQQYPGSWTARHQLHIANTLHLLLLVGYAQNQLTTVELALATLVMVSFDMFQRAMDWDAKNTDKSDHPPSTSSVSETLMTRDHSVQSDAGSELGASDSDTSTEDSKEAMVRLQGALSDLKTANTAKEGLLRRTRGELKNARDTLNETFAEYCCLRDEVKSIKQSMAREHQAVVYRKDIELFALRKGNEQKEKYIKDHDTKLEEVFQQQKATIDLKDAQIKMLKERLAFLDRQSSPRFSQEFEEAMDGDQALEVRLLRIKKAARRAEDSQGMPTDTPNTDEEKDRIIASLHQQLDATRRSADEVVNQQAELSRAWSIVKKVQGALKEERRLHTQTREQLQELAVKLEEEQQNNRTNPVGRLPTIEEDKDELESMFDKTQEDNLRLYGEMEALEKRLRDANSRMFNAEQQVNALQEEAQQQKTASDDPETARPSVVHHVHFQRMEMQLAEVHLCVPSRSPVSSILTRHRTVMRLQQKLPKSKL
jgi:hypothetical protein